MHTFLVAGFPRSGLLWLSRLFTVPHHSACISNGFGQIPGLELFWAAGENMCKDMDLEFFGNAATMNLILLPALLARRPLTKVLWVERELRDSMRSAQRAGFHLDIQLWQRLGQFRIRYAEHFDAQISFGDLGDQSAMRAIWAEVLPGVPWNPKRWEAYRRKRIVCDRSKTAAADLGALKQLLRDEAEEGSLPPLR